MSYNFYNKNLPPPAPQKIRYLHCEGFKVPCMDLQIIYKPPLYGKQLQPYIKGQMLIDETEWMPFELPVQPATDPFSWSSLLHKERAADKAYAYRDATTGEEGIELPEWTMPELVEWLLRQKDQARIQKEAQSVTDYRRYLNRPVPLTCFDESSELTANAYNAILKGGK